MITSALIIGESDVTQNRRDHITEMTHKRRTQRGPHTMSVPPAQDISSPSIAPTPNINPASVQLPPFWYHDPCIMCIDNMSTLASTKRHHLTLLGVLVLRSSDSESDCFARPVYAGKPRSAYSCFISTVNDQQCAE
ncbi:hypothetical protein CSKR_108686 [Clonorchis sinensis]|uniref:Uncharacterized protein n=1 Tax=Clonorchis sinensis TaxID=79923 RepID=A0A3R7FIN4_CLOSI|nr:hypothetical protein CSKR_108686 [Clonorchis sinensis]